MTHLTFTMYRLLSQRLLLCNEAILASYPFLGSLLLREGEGCILHFRTPDPRSKNTKLKMTGRPQIQRRIRARLLQYHFNSYRHLASTNCLEPRMLSDCAVPDEAQLEKEAGLPSWFSTVMCRGECVRRSLETS